MVGESMGGSELQSMSLRLSVLWFRVCALRFRVRHLGFVKDQGERRGQLRTGFCVERLGEGASCD